VENVEWVVAAVLEQAGGAKGGSEHGRGVRDMQTRNVDVIITSRSDASGTRRLQRLDLGKQRKGKSYNIRKKAKQVDLNPESVRASAVAANLLGSYKGRKKKQIDCNHTQAGVGHGCPHKERGSGGGITGRLGTGNKIMSITENTSTTVCKTWHGIVIIAIGRGRRPRGGRDI
jgi:hypothetical protein